VTADGVTIDVPGGWSLVPCSELAETSNCGDLAFILSNSGVSSPDLGCPKEEGTFGRTVFMMVQNLPRKALGAHPDLWPVRLTPTEVDDQCFVGWRFSTAMWNDAGRSFYAVAGVAPGSSAADRAALLTAFGSMSFGPATPPMPPPALESGSAAGHEWQVVLSDSDAPLTLDLYFGDRSVGAGFATPTPAHPIRFASRAFGQWVVFFGAVDGAVTDILPLGARGRATIIDLGPDTAFNAFVMQVHHDGHGPIRVRLEDEQGGARRALLTLGGGGNA
jgi:hypothetical protein